jgi:PAS domain S-box-containing protein
MLAEANQRMIFIVDDDRGLLRLAERALQREGFSTATAASGKEATAWLAEHRPDLLLLDLKLLDIQGSALIQQLAAAGRLPPFIIITGQGDERVAVDMMKNGAMDYVIKDSGFISLVPEIVKRALEQLETRRRLAEAEARVHLIQSVVDRGFSAVLIADAASPEKTVLYINATFSRLTGYSPADVVGKPLNTVSGLAGLHERLRRGMPAEQRFLEEITTYQAGGSERWGEWRFGPVKDPDGKITHWLVLLRDITDHKRLESEILAISDREQRRIGQDLHDGLCQHLSGIGLMSEVLEKQLAPRSPVEAGRIGEIAAHVREVIIQARQMARGLSPVTLESEGLMSALKELAGDSRKMFGVACEFECDSPVLIDDQAAATHLYRIAQEALTNGIKHGKASRIVLELARRNGRLVLSVSDNGLGLPPGAPAGRGMGLWIMRSRAGMIRGEISVENQAAGGVRVTCSIPLHNGSEQPMEQRAGENQKPKRKKTSPPR